MVNTLLVSELLISLSTSVGRWRRWRDQGPGNLSTAQRRPPLTGLHVRFIRSVSLKMLNVDHLGCVDSVPLSESKNRFLIRDLPDFAVERNVKSEIGFVTLVTFRKRVQYAWQPEPLKKWHVFYCLTNYVIIPCRILWSAVRIMAMEHKQIKKGAR